jgi:hypothetical protein
MAGAELFGLFYPLNATAAGERFGHGVAAVSEDDVNAGRLEGLGGIQDVSKQRLAGEGLENLRQGGTHPRALACRKNDDFESHEFRGSGLTGRSL